MFSEPNAAASTWPAPRRLGAVLAKKLGVSLRPILMAGRPSAGPSANQATHPGYASCAHSLPNAPTELYGKLQYLIFGRAPSGEHRAAHRQDEDLREAVFVRPLFPGPS